MVTIRAKGALYVTYNAIKYLFLLGVLSLVVFAFIDGKPLSSVEVLQIFGDVFLVLGAVVLLALLVLQTCEIIRYKLVIDENGIYIATNRDFMLIRHKDINISYERIKAIQYKKNAASRFDRKRHVLFLRYICLSRRSCRQEK